MKEAFSAAPKIISASAKSPAGVISLMMLALSVLGYAFFVDATETVRISMFVLMFVGYFILSLTVLRKSAVLSRKGVSRPTTVANPQEVMSRNLIPLGVAFKRLLLIWVIGGCPIFIVLLLQVIFGKLPETASSLLDLWGWLAPTIIPPASVVVIGLACSFWDNRDRVRVLFVFCCLISVVYLVIALGTILIEPFFPGEGEIRLLKLSTLVLTPMEGVLVALMAMLMSWTPSVGSVPLKVEKPNK